MKNKKKLYQQWQFWVAILFALFVFLLLCSVSLRDEKPVKMTAKINCECKEDCKVDIAFANITLFFFNDCIRELGNCYNLSEEEINEALLFP